MLICSQINNIIKSLLSILHIWQQKLYIKYQWFCIFSDDIIINNIVKAFMKGSEFLAEKIVDEILNAESQSREEIALANENASKALEKAKLRAKDMAEETIKAASQKAEEIITQAEKEAETVLQKAEEEATAESKKICSVSDDKRKEAVSAVVDCILNG